MNYDSLLHRNILPGKEFDKLFPPSTCKVEHLGTGLTDFTIDAMEDWVLEHYKEAEKVAKKLQQSSLSDTCKKLHWFLFNHFQYKADNSDQYLRAPGCAWYSRYEGMDCKSYSVLASCILMNQKIGHYIRKIKQLNDTPNDFTHVYVIVPKDQKTFDLSKGYFTIDGTLPTTTEPHFIDKSDLLMSLQHYGLKGTPFNSEQGLNGFNLNNVISGFSGLFCSDSNSAYKSDSMKRNLDLMNSLFSTLANEINAAKNAKNYNELSLLIAEFVATAKLINVTYTAKKKSKDWNSCSKKNFDGTIKASTYYLTASTALLGWRDSFFNKGASFSEVTVTNQYWDVAPNWWGMHFTPWIVINEKAFSLSEKKQAPNFELTSYIIESTNANNFNITSFLQTLTNVSQVISNPPGGQNSAGTGTYEQDFENTSQQPTTQTAGFGVFGWLLVAAGLGYAFVKLKDNGPGAKK